jgi:hypothetical protein
MIDILERPEIRRQPAPLSLEGYHVLRDLGLVPVKRELLDGVVVEKMTRSPLHTSCVSIESPSEPRGGRARIGLAPEPGDP